MHAQLGISLTSCPAKLNVCFSVAAGVLFYRSLPFRLHVFWTVFAGLTQLLTEVGLLALVCQLWCEWLAGSLPGQGLFLENSDS